MEWLLDNYILNCNIFVYLSIFFYLCITTRIERINGPSRMKFGMSTLGGYGMVITLLNFELVYF